MLEISSCNLNNIQTCNVKMIQFKVKNSQIVNYKEKINKFKVLIIGNERHSQMCTMVTFFIPTKFEFSKRTYDVWVTLPG